MPRMNSFTHGAKIRRMSRHSVNTWRKWSGWMGKGRPWFGQTSLYYVSDISSMCIWTYQKEKRKRKFSVYSVLSQINAVWNIRQQIKKLNNYITHWIWLVVYVVGQYSMNASSFVYPKFNADSTFRSLKAPVVANSISQLHYHRVWLYFLLWSKHSYIFQYNHFRK